MRSRHHAAGTTSETPRSFRRTAIAAASLLVCCLWSVGCSSVQAPSIEVENVRLTSQTDEAFVLVFDLALDNLNEEPQELDEFTYSVALDGRELYSGRRSAEATLASRRGKTIGLPAVIRYDRIGLEPGTLPASVRYSIRGELVYITPGAWDELLLNSGLYTPSVGFSEDGEASLR